VILVVDVDASRQVVICDKILYWWPKPVGCFAVLTGKYTNYWQAALEYWDCLTLKMKAVCPPNQR